MLLFRVKNLEIIIIDTGDIKQSQLQDLRNNKNVDLIVYGYSYTNMKCIIITDITLSIYQEDNIKIFK